MRAFFLFSVPELGKIVSFNKTGKFSIFCHFERLFTTLNYMKFQTFYVILEFGAPKLRKKVTLNKI